jgi:hypothetical protein
MAVLVSYKLLLLLRLILVYQISATSGTLYGCYSALKAAIDAINLGT